MPSQEISTRTPGADASRALRWAAQAWFAVAAFGQAAFIVFILAFYGTRTLAGRYAAWNDKPLITGYVPGDHAGNAVFAAHVLLASVVILGGLLQLVPALRRAAPVLHRWTGRGFLVIAGFLSISGVWMAIARGSYLSAVSAVAILINAVLILAFAALAWRAARQRRFELHRRWALRSFMVVSGVWFLRVGLMGWIVLNRRPLGMTDHMDGPTDVVMVFGSYMLPLAVLEVYFAAERSRAPGFKLAASALILLATAYLAAGVFGAITFMWWKHL